MLSTLKQPNQFDYNLPALWLKPLKCAVCSNEFVLRSKNARRPLLMKCFHSVCDRCCMGPRPILLTCNICNKVLRVEKHQAVREILDTNYYVLGILSYKEFNLTYDINFVDAHSPTEKRNEREKSSLQECSECNEALTNNFCVQCSVPYCKSCFERVHQHGKALQRHYLSHFDQRGKGTIRMENKRCRRHSNFINKYCCDCKQAMCVLCILDGHARHKISTLAEENQKSLAQIASLVETVKAAKNANKQAQKDAKFIARRYEEYATETIDDISRHFIYLHGVLQSIERNVLIQVKDHATRFLSKIQQSQSALKKGQEAFEDILNTLEGTMTQPPANYTVGNIVERTNSILESTPCNVEFSGVNSNPFLFVGLTTDFPNLYALEVVSQDLPPRIHTYFGDTSSVERSTQSSQRNNSNIASGSTNRAKLFPSPPRKAVQPQQKGKNKKSKNKKASVEDTQSINSTDRNILSMPNTSFGLKNATAQKVHVSHIKNPENFYVQVQKFLTIENSLDKCITEEAEFAPSPDYIDSGEVYLVFNGANQTWYRGEVLNGSPSEFYKVFLVDFGNSIQVPKQRFRVISETLKSKPYGAIQCSLYGVKPIKNEWNDRANQLMSEIIMNEIVSMIVYKEDTICQVDLITTHLTYPTSVRNALIFAELAVDDPNLPTEMQKRVQQLSNVRKSLLTPPTEKFYKSVFKEGESFRGIVLNVNDPHDFYAIKYDHNGVMDNLYEELNKDYQQPQQKLFTPLVNTPCAVYLDERWHRAKITKIASKANCTVWLVDKAQSQTVPYTQLRTLQPKFLSINECAFQCSLTDIEPHQKFGYSWTPSAIAEFKRIIQNPVLQIIVHRTQNFLHQVCLYIIKKDLDVNVNALLVKYKHANSTGPESQYVEYPKLNDLAKVDDDILNEINLMEMQINDVKKPAGKVRSKVKICHIVSPGEFYLTKVENQVAISKFHEEIQLSRSKDEVAPAKPYENVIDDDDLGAESKWKVGNYCLAKLRLKKDSSLQWYRAVITEIIEGDNGSPKYTVFLRDHGKTFQDIPSEQVAPIPGVYNRVCDGAIKCFLACIQPTGGLSTWSGSSIDEFKLITTKFENLAASIQGECQGDSIPVILWGLKQECTDPLAPTVYKWVNINKYLSNSGLVHLVEKFAPITEKNALNTDVPEGGESFNEWLKNLNTTVDRTLKETGQITILKHDTDFDISQEEAVIDTDEGEEFVTWLPAKENTKTVFMGIPTFVDNDGIIYLYDAAKKQVFDNISIVVNKVVKSTKPTTDSFWYVGQPCLAQYNIDGKFYRAVILETKPDRRVSVQFVDYGNVQECSVKDLRKQVVLTQIPIQVTKYRLDGIIPSGGKPKFSLTDLDFLYANIVNKQCAVRVSPNQQSEEIKLCSMKCGPIDIAELLIESGFACKSRQTPIGSPFLDAVLAVGKRTTRKARAAKLEKQRSKETTEDDDLDKKHEEIDEKSDDEDIIIEAILEEKPASKNSRDGIELDVDNYQELFEKIDLDNLKTLGRNFSDDNSDYDGREAESTYKPIYCRHVANDNASDESDGEGLVKDIDEDENMALIDQAAADTTPSSLDTKDMSTSTKLTKGKNASFEPFQLQVLPEDLKTFTGEVTYMIDCTLIAVYPIIPEHKKLIVELSKDIQIAAALAPKIKSFEPNTPCLAMFSEDKMWYRAMIRSYNPDENTVDVVFVDFFNAEWVPAKRVRVCPSDLIKVPLRNLPVKLAGLKPNPRWRVSDIQRKFSELVVDRQIFIKIVDYEGEIPLVELYEDGYADDLLYESLLTERFYLRN